MGFIIIGNIRNLLSDFLKILKVNEVYLQLKRKGNNVNVFII